MKRLISLLITVATLSAANPALACGWYLMKRPMIRVDPIHLQWEYDEHAPISKWLQVGEYDRASACHAEAGRWPEVSIGASTRMVQKAMTANRSLSPDEVQQGKTNAANTQLLCVATDDPRLAR